MSNSNKCYVSIEKTNFQVVPKPEVKWEKEEDLLVSEVEQAGDSRRILKTKTLEPECKRSRQVSRSNKNIL